MSTDPTPEAIVEDCRLIESGEVATDLKVTFYHVEARMWAPANKYSDDIYHGTDHQTGGHRRLDG